MKFELLVINLCDKSAAQVRLEVTMEWPQNHITYQPTKLARSSQAKLFVADHCLRKVGCTQIMEKIFAGSLTFPTSDNHRY